MIERLLADEVWAGDVFGELEGPLFPGEADIVAQAVPNRRREFTTGRLLARRVLTAAGVAPQPILAGRSREPRWPCGVVGSLTHCRGYRAAAVGHRSTWSGLGIDAEPDAALPSGVLDLVTSPAEVVGLATLVPGPHWDRILFSAKEAAYKAWFGLTGEQIGPRQLEIGFAGPGQFVARLPGALVLEGRWLVDRGLVTTAVTIGV